MKNSYLLIFGLLALGPRKAPGQAVASLSLEEVLERAINQRREIALQGLRINQAQADIGILAARRAPVLRSNADFRYNPVLQTSIIPGSAFQTGSSPGEDREIRFGTRANFLLGLEGTYRLSDPAYRSDMELALLEKGRATSVLDQEKLNIRFQVARAFFEAQLQREVLNLAEETLVQARNLLEVAGIQATNGTLLADDLLRFRRDEAVATQQRDIAEKQYHQLCEELAYQVGDPVGGEIEPRGEWTDAPKLPTVPSSADFNMRPDIAQAGLAMQVATLNQRKVEESYKPVLEAYTQVNLQHLSNDFAVWNRWFPFVFGGLRLQVNLFDGGLKQKNRERFSLEYRWQSENQEKLRAEGLHEWKLARHDLDQALRNRKIQEENIALASAILQSDERRFREGILLPTTLRESGLSVREAKQAAIGFLAEAFQARLRLMRAIGRIDP